MNLQRMDGSFNAAPDCIASHIYKPTEDGKMHLLKHLIAQLSGHFWHRNSPLGVVMWTCVRLRKFTLDVLYLSGLFLQQSLLIGGLKGIECVGVIQCSDSWTAAGWCWTIPNSKTHHTFALMCRTEIHMHSLYCFVCNMLHFVNVNKVALLMTSTLNRPGW